MEQRPLRLGDIVDDYCPRERRVTNHAVVALVEDNIRQTRCTTCDAEHVYKGAKEPRLRKKPAAAQLYDRVLADVTGSQSASTSAETPPASAASSAETLPPSPVAAEPASADSQPDE